MSGEAITLWTVRLALIFAFGAGLSWLIPRRLAKTAVGGAAHRDRKRHTPLLFWTLGCILYILHVAAAFHYVHDWSHANALAHTASRTSEVVGISYGGGLYFNYAFTGLWIADVAWQWIARIRRTSLSAATFGLKQKRLHATWLVYFLFITINATVVFGTGFTRWVSAAALVTLLVVWTLRDPKRLKEGAEANKVRRLF